MMTNRTPSNLMPTALALLLGACGGDLALNSGELQTDPVKTAGNGGTSGAGTAPSGASKPDDPVSGGVAPNGAGMAGGGSSRPGDGNGAGGCNPGDPAGKPPGPDPGMRCLECVVDVVEMPGGPACTICWDHDKEVARTCNQGGKGSVKVGPCKICFDSKGNESARYCPMDVPPDPNGGIVKCTEEKAADGSICKVCYDEKGNVVARGCAGAGSGGMGGGSTDPVKCAEEKAPDGSICKVCYDKTGMVTTRVCAGMGGGPGPNPVEAKCIDEKGANGTICTVCYDPATGNEIVRACR